MPRTITALFDTVRAAGRVAYDLGTRVGGVRVEVFGARTSGGGGGGGGLGALPREDADVLAGGVRPGGGVVRAEVPDNRFEAAADALEAGGAAGLDEREARWRREGWMGGAASAPAVAAPAPAGTASPAATSANTASATPTGGEVRRLGPATDEERLPIAEERLRVGKREAGHGRARVRSRVVETPVGERVAPHQERVEVGRRPADRPSAGADEAAFPERTIEAAETAEEAVAAKEARATEEVVVRKTAEERVETVSDTVQRTGVEVEDHRGRTGAATPAGATGTPGHGPGAA